MAPGILTLTTDFGTTGPYVAAMKGVVLGLAPGTQLVDVTHQIPPQDVEEGAFVLAGIVDAFPAGTVHLAVVDPGVGTPRRLVAVEVDGQRFVLPDNGLIGGVLRGRDPSGAWEIREPRHRRPVVSSTFHGRDILAPAAAHLLRGGDPADLGPPVGSLVLMKPDDPAEEAGAIAGRVVHVDSFGNLITNVGRGRLAPHPPGAWTVEVGGRTVAGLVATYGERPPGSLVGLVGSGDRVEVAVVNGDAARGLGLGRGAPVRLVLSREARP